MAIGFRHQCLMYEGPPSEQLPALGAVISRKLKENYRCLYMHAKPIVDEMQSHLSAKGLDVAYETDKTNLVFLSEQRHFGSDGRFNIERMLCSVEGALNEALNDGYQGLWVTGDMAWEIGPERDFSGLLEYEWRIEELFRARPEISAICQYHSSTLPRAILRQSLLCHSTIFLSETGSLANPYFLHPAFLARESSEIPELEGALNRLIQQNKIN